MALRVMVVDDALFMRNMLKDIFVRAGHEVVAEAENGEVALELYQELKPDLVTMDIVMPKKSGIEALQAQLDAKEIEVTSGGGAVKVRINGSGRFLGLTLDPEFLKEDPKLVADTVLTAVQDAAKQAKDHHEAEMQKVTGAFQMPGMF